MIWVPSRSSRIGIPVGSFVSPVWLSHMVGWGGLQQSGATLARGCCTGVAGSSGCNTGVVEPGFITEDLIVCEKSGQDRVHGSESVLPREESSVGSVVLFPS
jgi:hypothetical protein